MKVQVDIPELDVLIKTIRTLQERVNHLEDNQAPKEFFTYKQAADFICVSVPTLKRRIKKYNLQVLENESVPLIRKAVLEDYLLRMNPSMYMGEYAKYKKTA